ncbi:hypothetical protein [Pseudoalteromonas sp. MMG022]|uniref:hypothetical protein n=1 Tax=Pseudoalteromonas sp. MMG022 TaxID=2909978 RepID=UPI001F167D97|nr:hypothetical protein [Pseudoalteromonas sp. MMG022]MCF6435221.1 hypothetical protein [Pseudoalteromonas sp. MMG022]
MILTDKEASNDFIDGEFTNATSQLLPWPQAVKFGSFMDVHGVVSDTHASSIPNPYEPGCFVNIQEDKLVYHNADGSVRWIKTVAAIIGNHKINTMGEEHQHVFHVVNGVTYLVGSVEEIGKFKIRLYRVNLSNQQVVVGEQTAKWRSRFTIVEDNTLLWSYRDGTDGISGWSTKAVNFNTMTPDSLTTPVAITDNIKNVAGSGLYRSPGVALFNGSLTLSYSAHGNSVDSAMYSVLFGINRSLNTSQPEVSKASFRTYHSPALNSFHGYLSQVSKDLFMTLGDEITTQASLLRQRRRIYYTREALEQWANDCIYAQTGFRIGA